MKVAICLTGHLRHGRNFSSIVENLVKPLKADVFIHTWDSSGNKVDRNKSRGKDLGPVPNEDEKLSKQRLREIRKIFNPKKITIESNKDFLIHLDPLLKAKSGKILHFSVPNNKWGIGGAAEPKYILSQMYGVNQSFLLACSFEKENDFKYDYIIKLRIDYFVDSGLSLEEIVHSKSKKFIFVPHEPFANHGHPICEICLSSAKYNLHKHKVEEICDVFAHGSRAVMERYMCTYSNWENIQDEMFKENYNLILNQLLLKSQSKNEYTPFELAMATKDFKFLECDQKWYNKNYKLTVDIHHGDNILLNCFYPERFLMKNLEDLNFKISPIRGRLEE